MSKYLFMRGLNNPVHRPEVKEKLTLSALLRHGNIDRSAPARNQLFGNYKMSAIRRGYNFSLSKDEFKLITSSICYYCGDIPNNKISKGRINSKHISIYIHNGIDRVNNNIGYELSNCVSCCKLCNKMKRANSIELFIEQAIKIAKKQGGIS